MSVPLDYEDMVDQGRLELPSIALQGRRSALELLARLVREEGIEPPTVGM